MNNYIFSNEYVNSQMNKTIAYQYSTTTVKIQSKALFKRTEMSTNFIHIRYSSLWNLPKFSVLGKGCSLFEGGKNVDTFEHNVKRK